MKVTHAELLTSIARQNDIYVNVTALMQSLSNPTALIAKLAKSLMSGKPLTDAALGVPEGTLASLEEYMTIAQQHNQILNLQMQHVIAQKVAQQAEDSDAAK